MSPVSKVCRSLMNFKSLFCEESSHFHKTHTDHKTITLITVKLQLLAKTSVTDYIVPIIITSWIVITAWWTTSNLFNSLCFFNGVYFVVALNKSKFYFGNNNLILDSCLCTQDFFSIKNKLLPICMTSYDVITWKLKIDIGYNGTSSTFFKWKLCTVLFSGHVTMGSAAHFHCKYVIKVQMCSVINC